MENKVKTYEVDCVCTNCGNGFEASIPKGVKLYTYEHCDGLYYHTGTYSRETISCPKCEVSDVVKRF